MKILILGGTIFLGRALVEAALKQGHEITLFNRGKSNPDLFSGIETLHGDRDGNLAPLEGRRWDVVIDTCGYVPRVVRQSAELLAEAVDHYTFISSISVYADMSRPNIREEALVGELVDETVEEITAETYGPLKAACELAAAGAMPGRVLNIRPGLIVGPHDPSDRFTYWPVRVSRGGPLLAPGWPERIVQFIDVRDLADWTVAAVEARLVGTYNATGPAEPLPMGQLLETCRRVSGSQAEFIWVSEAFLQRQEVKPWIELPLWLPEADDSAAGLSAVDCRKAIAAGLTFRPVAETVAATLEWSATRPDYYKWRAGLTPEREQALLAAWREEAESSL